MRRTIGLRLRLFLAYVPLVLVATIALAVYLLSVARERYVTGIEEQLLGQARLVSVIAATEWGNPAALDALAKREGQQIGNRVTLIALDGTVFGDSEADPSQMENHANRPEVQQALARGYGEYQRHSRTVGTDFIYAAVPITRDNQIVGVARMARTLNEINAQLDLLRNVAIAGVIASGALAASLVWLLARYILQPVNALTELAGALAAGRLSRRSEPRTNDELGQLERAFNRMAGELEDTIGVISDERRQLAALLETLGDGLLLIDDQGTIVLANSAASRLLNPPGSDDLRGRDFVTVVRDHDLVALVASALRERTVQTVLTEYGLPRRTLRAVATPVRGVAESSALLILQDLTELRRLETARRDFVANISHELRTPLASIKALVETLEDGAIRDEEVARHFFSQIGGEVDHLTQLVHELLELSRIESGQVSITLQPVSPADILAKAVERLRAQAERAGLTLHLDPAPLADLPEVIADPERIGQVLLNLLHNAIKFTPPGGTIELLAERRGASLAISVRDSGTGIDPADLPRIFERFYKADRSRSGGGTGLGLSIARHLISAHGGTLSAENNRGARGATFTFTLPFAKSEAAIHEA